MYEAQIEPVNEPQKLCNLSLDIFLFDLLSDQVAGDDSAMNGVDFTCYGSSTVIDFPGIWGDWQTEMVHCDGGFSGLMVKFEEQVFFGFWDYRLVHACLNFTGLPS